MILACRVLCRIYLKQRKFYFNVNRCVSNGPIMFEENNLFYGEEPKRKITVVKRKFLRNKQESVLEWKSAANVIKRLNTEYKYLYGPMKTNGKDQHPDLAEDLKNEIIQHETQIPIIEPPTGYNEQEIDFNSILTFPLVNTCIYQTDKIKKLNLLRKYLESLCKGSSFPSVSLILQNTMSKERIEILDKWKQNMISQMGEKGFEKYQSELLANGASLHHSICSYLVSTPESELHIKEENIGHWNSLKSILPKIKDVKLIEELVVHPFLCYKGIVDCFAKYRDHLVVIDWKTSKKSKENIKNTYDNPLQIAAYVGALNFDPKYQYLANKGLIVVAYENGIPASTHFLDGSTMEHYWNEWLQRVKQFWEIKISESETT